MKTRTIVGLISLIGGGILTAVSAIKLKNDLEEDDQIHEKADTAQEILKTVWKENEMSVEQIAGAFGVEEALRVAEKRGEIFSPQDNEETGS